MQLFVTFAAVTIALAGPRPEPAVMGAAALPTKLELANCFVSPKQRANISAEESGVLAAIFAPEGTQVVTAQRPGEDGQAPIVERPVLGRLNDTRARMQREVAYGEAQTAKDQAESNVNVDFAIAGKNVAASELQQAVEANRRVPGTVADAEVLRRRFAVQRADLQIEQAKLEKTVGSYALHSKTAALRSAEDTVERHQIRAPFDGIVVEVKKQVGEWVNAGDPVFRLSQMDEMWVEGFVSSRDYLPSDLHHRKVRVTIPLIGTRLDPQDQIFEGYIEFVSPEVNPVNHEFKVKALVKNRQKGGQWLMRQGLPVNMTIDLAAPPVHVTAN